MRKLFMSNFFVFTISALVVLFFTSCEKHDNEIINPSNTLKTSYPERPNLKVGESNWKGSIPPAMSPTAIADLNTLTAQDLINALIGGGPDAPTISNISFTGANVAAGTFSGGLDAIGFESGIILSSGNVASIAGPNLLDGTTTSNGTPGDADLNTLIPGYTTLDAAVLEFDFECTEIQVISFQYVFASEEYNEYVNSQFNDVFGFFVNGVNIALIPGTSTPVAINNVNCGNPYNAPGGGSYCEYFRNNDLQDGGGSIDTEMDGLTTVFYATAAINPGVNTIKIAIADAGDRILDSKVLIKGESFVCAPPPPPPGDECPYSQGYWKTHPESWPASAIPMMLGTINSYSQAELLSILNTGVSRDASLILAKQLIAAKLNVANGAPVPSDVTTAIQDADLAIGTGVIPMGVRPNTALGQTMTSLAKILDDYNNNLLTPDCGITAF